MLDGPLDTTSVDKSILTRLIAAARVAGPVSWSQAAAEAEHDVADLWGEDTRHEQVTHVEVSSEVLLQLAAAAGAAVAAAGAQHSGAAWVGQVAGDLMEIQHLTGPLGN